MNILKPKLVVVCGCLLAFFVSAVNAGFVTAANTSVCHMTGDISRIALNLTSLNRSHLPEFILIGTAMLGFLAGATISGAAVHHPRIDLTRPYGRMITFIGLLLLTAHWLLPRNANASIGLGALACGMQNALATRYRGIVLRTTHLTGLLTDLGVSMGMRLRGHAISNENIRIPAMLIASFLLGAAAGFGSICFLNVPIIAMTGAIYVAAGIVRFFFWHRTRRHAVTPACTQTMAGGR
jgi:uncharacterized membrane protein YoaK (UPF0700 family)